MVSFNSSIIRNINLLLLPLRFLVKLVCCIASGSASSTCCLLEAELFARCSLLLARCSLPFARCSLFFTSCSTINSEGLFFLSKSKQRSSPF